MPTRRFAPRGGRMRPPLHVRLCLRYISPLLPARGGRYDLSVAAIEEIDSCCVVPHAVECRFHSRPGRIPFDRTLLPSQRKSDHDPQRISRRPHDFHHDGVHRGRESANSLKGRHARRRSRIRHVHLCGRSDAGDGLCTRTIPSRLLPECR